MGMIHIHHHKLWLMVALVVVVVEGCLEEERIALLQLKPFFFPSSTEIEEAAAWGKDSNCCNWTRVECNSTAGRVTHLDLTFLHNTSSWYLNCSLFIPFQEIKSLNLAGNYILGCLENEGFERLSNLGNLEVLDLSFNSFDNSILASLGSLSSLKSLYLSYNKLEGSINIGGEFLCFYNNGYRNSNTTSNQHTLFSFASLAPKSQLVRLHFD
ncbi:hypothetical protein Tsubulata_045508 [Turnera subulata]|uniref:Leucine-rich repeat-containing N-terminal plant-type domain-containing protein n=1 Tax=Turnera subulata TaxID=218843 RepID=A0A9Q0JLF1_9ROSI|nr:hypothetical protein Tsubulata_045508 [Turnera subulata]